MSSSKTPQEVVELVTDEHKLKAVASKSHGDITLVPQPSDDPRDPLNWPTRKKNLIFFTVCLAAFSGVASVNVHQLAYVRQASYYHKSPAELSHSISAGIAGLVGGPLLFVPLASVIGRSSLVFWCQVVSLVSNIWGPLMTGPNDYIPFVMSRLMAGLFGIIPAILASGYIMDLYFLHQRGKAFTALEVCLLAGAVVAPVFGGFIANSKPWPYVYWWLVAVIGVSVILSFVFLRETSFERDGKTDFHFDAPKSFIANRIATFFPGTAVVPRTTVSHIIKRYVTPFRIGLSPVALIPGIFVILIYGFAIGLGIEASIFLQTPEARGGYGFTPLRNALFNFSYWSGLILCQICGALLNDRLPLWISRRNGGTWHPEYRLYNILLVIAASPIGLGIFGAGLEYHLHYMVLAVGTFLVMFGACYSTPITVNYVTECFTNLPLEVAVTMNVYRQIFGLSLPFFVLHWQAAVGSGWMFGMMAFFCVLVSALMGLLIWKGQVLRQYSLVTDATEDGIKVTNLERTSTLSSSA